jgi:hypothetical protein
MNNEANHWWGCPHCPKTKGPDDVYNAGSTHVAACHTHRTTWRLGSNLFSSWKGETEAYQRERYREIEGYARIDTWAANDANAWHPDHPNHQQWRAAQSAVPGEPIPF